MTDENVENLTQEITTTDNTEKTPTVNNSDDKDTNGTVLPMETIKSTFTDEQINELDKDGDGQVTTQELKKYVENKTKPRSGSNIDQLKTKFSQRTLQKMDKDGDGVISNEEMHSYIGRVKGSLKRYKCGLIWSIILFFFFILGTFVLGFELTKQFEFNDNKVSNIGARSLTDTDGNRLTTVGSAVPVKISQFWDDDVSDNSKSITFHRGYYDNTLIIAQISRVEITDTVATLFDYTGLVWFEYHRNGANITVNNSSTITGNWVMYRTDSDGNTEIIGSDYDTERRRLRDSNVPAERRLQDASTPSPTEGVGVSVP